MQGSRNIFRSDDNNLKSNPIRKASSTTPGSTDDVLVDAIEIGYNDFGDKIYEAPQEVKSHPRSSLICQACSTNGQTVMCLLKTSRSSNNNSHNLGKWMVICPNFKPGVGHGFQWLTEPSYRSINVMPKTYNPSFSSSTPLMDQENEDKFESVIQELRRQVELINMRITDIEKIISSIM